MIICVHKVNVVITNMKYKQDVYLLMYNRLMEMDGITNDIVSNIMMLGVDDVGQLYELSDESIKETFSYFSNDDLIDSSTNYDVRFMRLAREFSTWSKDPKKQVGCVAVRDRQVIAQGYNGFPRGVKDNWRLYVKSIKLPMVVHAELNMIVNASRNGVNLIDSTAYVFGLPTCSSCVKPLIQSGVSRIVMCDSTEGNSKSWSADSETFKLTKNMLDECEIPFSFIDNNMLVA